MSAPSSGTRTFHRVEAVADRLEGAPRQVRQRWSDEFKARAVAEASAQHSPVAALWLASCGLRRSGGFHGTGAFHMAELGIIATAGMTSIGKLIAILRDDRGGRLPISSRAALLEKAEQIERLTTRIEALDTRIVAAVKADEAARRLTTIPGVGAIIAATVRTAIQDPVAFRTRRDLAACIGITPKANSSGGKERLGKISKQGNKQLRTLLTGGATSILKQARRGVKLSA